MYTQTNIKFYKYARKFLWFYIVNVPKVQLKFMLSAVCRRVVFPAFCMRD